MAQWGPLNWPDDDDTFSAVRYPYSVSILHRRGHDRLLEFGRKIGLTIADEHDGGFWQRSGLVTAAGPAGDLRMFLKIVNSWNQN